MYYKYIFIGSDHAGYQLKHDIVLFLQQQKYTNKIIDCGPYIYDRNDNYPDFIFPTAIATANTLNSIGIIIGGSGNGELIVANKVQGIRAALVWSNETAKLAKEHNNANVISIGARMHTKKEVLSFINTFCIASYMKGRHMVRLNIITQYELNKSL